jgi:hypothetical protein
MSKVQKKTVLSVYLVINIKTAAENDLIYDRFGIDNEDDYALVDSIRQHGIREPLTITSDGYVVSGHRRLAAAKRIGLKEVPARIIQVHFELMNSKERMDLLRLHNYQRSKSASERIREKMLEIDPSHAHSEMVKRRIKNRNRSDPSCVAVRMGRVKKRPKITTLQFLAKVKEIITENEPYWPLTDRRIHYLLLNAPPLKHDKKPDSKYQNDKNSYKALTHLLIRARLSGEIPMQAIEDSTRPIQLAGGFQSLEQFVGQEVSNFLNGYTRELTIGQPDHIEIMLEKNALRSVVEAVARDYCIPVTTGRGFSSLSPRYELQQRFLKSGKSRLVLLMLTDFDPDGEMIASSFARSLRDDLGLVNIVAVKVALNADDVINYNLPSDMDAKPSSPNYESFVERFGTKAVELDAIPVQLLQQKLREAIEQYLDMDEFNAQLKLEQQDAVEIEAYRKVLMETITPIKKDDSEDPPLPIPTT